MRISDWSSDVCSSDLGGYLTSSKTNLGPERPTTAASAPPRWSRWLTIERCRKVARIPCALSPSYRSRPRASARRRSTLGSDHSVAAIQNPCWPRSKTQGSKCPGMYHRQSCHPHYSARSEEHTSELQSL